jgi:hypothetical protein
MGHTGRSPKGVRDVRQEVSPGGHPRVFPKRDPSKGALKAGPQRVVPKVGSPKGVPTSGSSKGRPLTGVPQGGSPKRGPAREDTKGGRPTGYTKHVPQGDFAKEARKGNPQGGPQGGKPWGPQGRSPKVRSSKVPNGAPKGVSPKGCHPTGYQMGLAQGVNTRGDPTGFPQRGPEGSLKGDPKDGPTWWVPQWGFSRGSHKEGHPRKVIQGWSPKRDPTRGFLRESPTGGPPKGRPWGFRQEGSPKGFKKEGTASGVHNVFQISSPKTGVRIGGHKWGSQKGSPSRDVPLEGYNKGRLSRGFNQVRSKCLKGPKSGSTRGRPSKVSPIVSQLVPLNGCHRRVSPKVKPTRSFPERVSPRGSPRRIP